MLSDGVLGELLIDCVGADRIRTCYLLRDRQEFLQLNEALQRKGRWVRSHDGRREHLASRGTQRLLADGEMTRSECDWAFAKCALARGDDPEEVTRHIADYRAEDIHFAGVRRIIKRRPFGCKFVALALEKKGAPVNGKYKVCWHWTFTRKRPLSR